MTIKSSASSPKPTRKTSRGVDAGVDPAPSPGAPLPPKGFKAGSGSRRGGQTPTAQQVRDAGDVAKEIGDSAHYDDDFGKRAPEAEGLAAALRLAKAWSNELAATETWGGYVREQWDRAWRAVFAQTKELQPEFDLAAKHDPSVGKRYPQTKDFLGVRRALAAKGAATRSKNRKAGQKAP